MYDNANIPLNMPLMEVPVPTIEEAGLVIDDLLQERQNLKAIKEDCEFRIQDIDKEVGHMLDQKDVKTVVWKDSLVIRRQGSKPRPILDRVLLLDAGVTPQQLNAGTKFGKAGEPGLTVRSLSETKAKESQAYKLD
jgi:hypothetical protein